jgi:parallel beta-helix repeat protein
MMVKKMNRKKVILISVFLFLTIIYFQQISAYTTISEHITNNTIWTNGNTYYISANINVMAGDTLTIEEGTIVKFAPNITLSIYGNVNASNDSSMRYFTSRDDDTVGEIISESDGVPAVNDWSYIYFTNGSTGNLNNCTIKYANTGILGASSFPDISNCIIQENQIGINVNYYSPNIVNCQIQDNDIGIYIHGGTPVISSPNTIQNNLTAGIHFYNCTNPSISNQIITNNTGMYGAIWMHDTGEFNLGSGNTITGNSWPLTMDPSSYPNSTCIIPSVGNTNNSIQVFGGWCIQSSVWPDLGLDYIVTSNVTIDTDGILIINPGVTVCFEVGKALIVNGTFNAMGELSNPILFTRFDTSGSWLKINFNENSSGSMSYCTIEHANIGIYGYSNFPTLSNCTIQNNQTGVYAYNTSPDLNDCLIQGNETGVYMTEGSPILSSTNTIQNNTTVGIYCNDCVSVPIISNQLLTYNIGTYGAIRMINTGVFTIDSSNTITGNSWPLSIDPSSFPSDTSFIPPTGNTNNGIQVQGIGSGLGSGTWPNLFVDYIITSSAFIKVGDVLTLEPGIILKFEMSQMLAINGVLQAVGDSLNPIVFTSRRSLESWGGVQFNSNSFGNLYYCIINNAFTGLTVYSSPTLNYVDVFDNTMYGIIIYGNASPTISNCKIKNNAQSGICCTSTACPEIRWNLIYNNHNGITAMNNSAPIINYNDFINNTIYDLECLSDQNINALCNYWDSTTTVAMEANGNPKNIETIYDQFDDSLKGIVDYSNWLLNEPAIIFVSPNIGENIHLTSISIRGKGFRYGATVKLSKFGCQDIIGTETSYIDSSKIITNFDLVGRQLGDYNIVITNPDNEELTLLNGFTIGEGYTNLWVDIIGRNEIRPLRHQTYVIRYGNHGNINAICVPLWISGILKDTQINLQFDIIDPPQMDGQELIDWSQIPIYAETDKEIILPFLIPIIPVNYDGIVKIGLTIQPHQFIPFEIHAWLGEPFFFSQPHWDLIQCIGELGAAIMQFPPGYDCLFSALLFLQEWIIKNYESPIGQTQNLFSHFMADINLLNQCSEFTLPPVYAQVVDLMQDINNFWSLVKPGSPCYKTFNIWETTHSIQPVIAMDPNEKTGPIGIGDMNAIPIEGLFDYIVYFENVDSATAAAEEVLVIDTLDANLDFSTYSIQEIVFGDTIITIPQPSKTYSDNIVLNDTTHVQITCSFDSIAGIAQWYLRGTDPRDGWYMGFLPPNVNSPEGEGHIAFTIEPKQNLVSGTQIRNRASIIFDVNPPMMTNEVFNTIDAEIPESEITNIAHLKPPYIKIDWMGQDDSAGSGIKSFSLFASGNGGPYSLWLNDTLCTEGIFTAEEFSRYDFYSEVIDSVGHKEPMPMEPDTSIQPMAFYEFPQQAWYMISLPVDSEEDSIKYLFPSSFGAFQWNSESQIYLASEVLSSNIGYWLALPEGDSLIISGTLVDTIQYHYQPGWHIIRSTYEMTDVSNPNDNPDGAVLAFFGWDAQTGQYFQTTTIYPKHAYWAAVMVECDLILGSELPLSKITKVRRNKSNFYKKFGDQPPAPPAYFIENDGLSKIPETYKLYQNYPNPFNPVTNITFDLPEQSKVTIMIFNILGQKVKTLVNKKYNAGSYKIQWDGRNDFNKLVSSGVYIIRIEAGPFHSEKKLITIR